MNLINLIKNKNAQVPWMWLIVGVIISLLILSLGLVLVGKSQALSQEVLVLSLGE